LILLEKFHPHHQDRGKVFDQREISADGNLIKVIFVNKERRGSFAPAGIKKVITLVSLSEVDSRVGGTKEVGRGVWRTRSIVATNNKNK